jgi:tripartite-type tricarboxylate transporter receptor subunit TctC
MRNADSRIAGLAILLAGFATAIGSASLFAQSYPSKPVRVIVAFPPGGGTDTMGRALAQKLTDALKQSVFVENRAGAAGVIGADIVAKSPPDGHTLLFASSAYVISAAVQPKLPYDAATALVPVSFAALTPNLVLVHPSVPAKNVKELIALARKWPGELNYGSTGNGAPYHIATEMFKNMAKVDLVHVPYKGAAPALTATISGEVTVLFGNIVSALPHARQGRLRALAVTTTRRSPIAPELPTVAEAALPGYDFATWFGMLAPAGTPPAVISRLNQEIARALQLPDFRQRLLADGAEPGSSTPEEFGRIIQNDIKRFAALAKAVNMKVD